MNTGLILLILAGILVAFGVGQRALDKLRLTDSQAFLFIALMIILGFAPEIRLGIVDVNLGGCVIPVLLSVYLFAKAGSAWERWRSVIASVVTAAAVYALMRFLPDEPETTLIDPNWLYGISAAVIACILGRSRRGAFIGGVIGSLIAQVVSVIPVWVSGVNQQLVLGGAGAFDTVVIAGILGVMLSELFGEIKERIVRGTKRPTREFVNGEFVNGEEEK